VFGSGRWRWSRLVVASWLLASSAAAQSVSVEERSTAPSSASPPVTAPVPRLPTVDLVLPEPIVTPLGYPEGAHGEADVDLLLTLNAAGHVTEVEVVQGSAPFASHAVAAARAWTFRPARRGARAVGARIRFRARFVPPEVASEPEPEPEPAPAPASSPSRANAPLTPSEIVVTGQRVPNRHQLGRAEISRMPGAFDDPFRAIEALPGVVPLVSGLPYFYVRGAPPGNVGYFFDGVAVPFLYHFGAGPGVFHPAFVERVELYPGAYPARYGRFAGAIVAGELAEPTYSMRGEWKVRAVDSGAMVEAPFAGGRGVAMAAGRFSYAGLVLSLVSPNIFMAYGDYQARVRYDLTRRDSIELLAFGSSDYVTNDKTELAYEQGIPTQATRTQTVIDAGFHRVDLRWNHRLDAGSVRTALTVGRDYTGLSDGQVDVHSNLIGVRSDLRTELSHDVGLGAGVDLLVESLHQQLNDRPASRDGLVPGLGENTTPADLRSLGIEDGRRRDLALGAYAELAWDATPDVRITPGLRSDVWRSGDRAAAAFDPRLSAEYRIGKRCKVMHGLALVHQAPSFVGAVPGLKPSLAGGLQTAVQASSGVTYELPAGFSTSFSLFQSAFHDMTDVISLVRLRQVAKAEQTRADPTEPPPPSRPTDERTNGHAYGAELMVRRSLAKRVGGFVSYTLSRSLRSKGRTSGPATTDRTHVLNVAASVDLGRHWRLGGRVLFYSGVPAEVAYVAAARHPPRTPPFWRLDFKLEKRWYIQPPRSWWGLSLEVLNTTLNQEVLKANCNAYSCHDDRLGPITVPSIAVEGGF